MDNEIYEILNGYKEAINLLLDKVDSLEERLEGLNKDIESLRSTLFDEILAPSKAFLDETEKNERFNDFKSKYGERLGAYDERFKAISQEDDYDTTRNAFEEYDGLDPKPESDAFVDELIGNLEDQIETVKQSLGIPSDKPVEITQDENGNTEVTSEGETVLSEENTEETEEEASEESDKEDGSAPATELDGQGELNFDEESKEDDPEEVKKYEEEIAKLL